MISFDSIRRQAIDGVQGMTVLDLGGYDGEFAALALARGAKTATVVDNEEWRQYDWPEPPRWPGVKYVKADILAWRKSADFVICYNVLYHAREPLAFLAHLRKLTRHRLALCTSYVIGEPSGWRWYPDGMGHENGTVWARPTPEGLIVALMDAGFASGQEIGRVGDHIVVVCE